MASRPLAPVVRQVAWRAHLPPAGAGGEDHGAGPEARAIRQFDRDQAAELLRKVKAAQYVRSHPGEVCPAKWEEGEATLAPSLDLVGKI